MLTVYAMLPLSPHSVSVNRTACKLRLQAPSALGTPAAGYLKRLGAAIMHRLRLHPSENHVCAAHGNQGILPCPWPDCKNGVSDAQFEEEPLFEKERPTVYSRREWRSPLGDTYYSWDSSELPNWFFAPQTFWNEARRHKLVADTAPKVVYHYTSLEGFIGIVKGRSIWMSDFSYLNDRRELTYGADLVKNAIRRISESETESKVLSLLSTWNENLNTLQNRVCIASFSGDDDSLSQWRAYGPLAIGFTVYPLALHVNQARLQPVEYNPDAQQKLIDIYLHHLCSAYAYDIASGRLERLPDVYQKVERLLELIVFFKDPAFRSEHEYRLAYIDNPEVVTMFGLTKTEKAFRVAKGKIIPYVSSVDVLPSKVRNFPLEIEEIVLGPESDDLLERGVREFLDAQDMTAVKVRRSAVPLRP